MAGLAKARAEGRVVEYVRSGEACGKVIEGEAQEHPAEEMSKPFVHSNSGLFRRF